MNKELREIINNDLKRYGGYSLPFTFKQKLFLSAEVKYLIAYRKAAYHESHSSKLLSFYYNYKLFKLQQKTSINIPSDVKIGKGFYIGHLGRIIINPDVVIGDNVNIATGVTIGQANRGSKAGAPIIGNKVWIGTNAVIVGKITIGDDVLIAPGAFINTDIPSHSVVIGNPAVIHTKENATAGYINHVV